LRRICTQPDDIRERQHAAARNLRHDHQCHDAGTLCAGDGDDAFLVPDHSGYAAFHPAVAASEGAGVTEVLVVNPNTTASMTETIALAAGQAAAPGTTIRRVTSAAGPVSIEGYYDEAFAVPGLLAEIRA